MHVSVIFTPLLATCAVARSVSYPLGQTPIDKVQSQHQIDGTFSDAPGDDVCPLPPKVAPPNDGFHSSLDFIGNPTIFKVQAERLQRVVQIPTTSTELEDDPWSDYYAPFLDLHVTLTELFPLMYVSSSSPSFNNYKRESNNVDIPTPNSKK